VLSVGQEQYESIDRCSRFEQELAV
jgi:hypothetical protein